MSKNKSNKNFIIGASITLLVLFGVSLGATYGITLASIDDKDYIKFTLDGKEYDITDFDGDADATLTREVSYEDESSTMLSKFYSAALFGTTDFIGFNGANHGITNILGGEWNTPESFTKGEEAKYTQAFVNMKLLSDASDESIYKYLYDLGSTSQDVQEAMLALQEKPNYLQLTIFDLYNDKTDGLYEQVVKALSTDVNYQESILEEMFVFSYLWQDSNKKSYDYNFTQSLVESKASIVSQLDVDYDVLSDDANMKYLSNNDKDGLGPVDKDGNPTDLPVVSEITAEQWNDVATSWESISGAYTTTDYTNKLSDDGFAGFKGIQFGTTDNTSVHSNFTDITNTWNVDTTANKPNLEEPVTNAGDYTNTDILTTANLYLATPAGDDANGKGAVLSSTGNFGLLSGDATIVASSQLYPYVFAEMKGDEISSYLANPTYSLYANVDDTTGNITKGDKDGDLGHNEYIFNRWFGEDNAQLGEIYVAEALMNHDSSIKDRAFEYWNQQGFYIELSGAAKDNYLSFVPSGLLKKED